MDNDWRPARPDDLITYDEAAALVGRKPRTLRWYVKHERLTAHAVADGNIARRKLSRAQVLAVFEPVEAAS